MRTAAGKNRGIATILTQSIITKVREEIRKTKAKIEAIIPIQNITVRSKKTADKIKTQTKIRIPEIIGNRAVDHGWMISR